MSIFDLIVHQNAFAGLRSGPHCGELTALPTPLAGFLGPFRVNGMGKGEREWKEGKRKGGGGRKRSPTSFLTVQPSDVNKDWTCKDKDKDFTYSYLLQVAAKPTIAIKQQQ